MFDWLFGSLVKKGSDRAFGEKVSTAIGLGLFFVFVVVALIYFITR